MRTKRILIVGVVSALALTAPACASGSTATDGGTSGGASTTSAPSPRPSSTAHLRILSPTNGETSPPTVHVRLALTGARIVQTTSTNLRPDEGHIHLYLDGQIVSMNYQLANVIPNVPPGQHVIRAEFVATDHAPFEPRVFVQVVFEVKA
jgi:hypothetical protein